MVVSHPRILPGSQPLDGEVGNVRDSADAVPALLSSSPNTGCVINTFLIMTGKHRGLLRENELWLSQAQYNLHSLFHTICVMFRSHIIFVSSNCSIVFISYYWNLFLPTRTTQTTSLNHLYTKHTFSLTCPFTDRYYSPVS